MNIPIPCKFGDYAECNNKQLPFIGVSWFKWSKGIEYTYFFRHAINGSKLIFLRHLIMYSHLNLSLSVNIHKCMWLKKEYLTEYDVGLQPDGTWRYETIFEKAYKKCLEKFASFWQQFM